jgi:glucokinase
MKSVPGEILLGDIGGTNARFTFVKDDEIGPVEAVAVKDYSRFTDALAAVVNGGQRESIASVAFAAAGPVDGNRCRVTNSGWVIDASEIRNSFNGAHVRIVNDFEALAWSLPRLLPSALVALGGGEAVRSAPAAVLGPGTGLGLACLSPRAAGDIVISTEGGHATLAGTCRREDAIIEHLRSRFGHVSAERVLSGAGLVNLYQAVISIDGRPMIERSAAEITMAGLDGSCVACREALDLFCAMLGTFAGNVALTFAARGGIYIGGGIAPRIIAHLRGSQFRARFEAKGRFQSYLAAIPTSVIIHPNAALLGLRQLAERAFDT